MPSELLNLTAKIVIAHASMTALTTNELVTEIKDIHKILVFLESKVVVPEPKPAVIRQPNPRKVKMKLSSEAKAVQDEEGPVVGDPDYMEFMESREG
jgi:predicted transcriptional regulator